MSTLPSLLLELSVATPESSANGLRDQTTKSDDPNRKSTPDLAFSEILHAASFSFPDRSSSLDRAAPDSGDSDIDAVEPADREPATRAASSPTDSERGTRRVEQPSTLATRMRAARAAGVVGSRGMPGSLDASLSADPAESQVVEVKLKRPELQRPELQRPELQRPEPAGHSELSLLLTTPQPDSPALKTSDFSSDPADGARLDPVSEPRHSHRLEYAVPETAGSRAAKSAEVVGATFEAVGDSSEPRDSASRQTRVELEPDRLASEQPNFGSHKDYSPATSERAVDIAAQQVDRPAAVLDVSRAAEVDSATIKSSANRADSSERSTSSNRDPDASRDPQPMPSTGPSRVERSTSNREAGPSAGPSSSRAMRDVSRPTTVATSHRVTLDRDQQPDSPEVNVRRELVDPVIDAQPSLDEPAGSSDPPVLDRPLPPRDSQSVPASESANDRLVEFERVDSSLHRPQTQDRDTVVENDHQPSLPASSFSGHNNDAAPTVGDHRFATAPTVGDYRFATAEPDVVRPAVVRPAVPTSVDRSPASDPVESDPPAIAPDDRTIAERTADTHENRRETIESDHASERDRPETEPRSSVAASRPSPEMSAKVVPIESTGFVRSTSSADNVEELRPAQTPDTEFARIPLNRTRSPVESRVATNGVTTEIAAHPPEDRATVIRPLPDRPRESAPPMVEPEDGIHDADADSSRRPELVRQAADTIAPPRVDANSSRDPQPSRHPLTQPVTAADVPVEAIGGDRELAVSQEARFVATGTPLETTSKRIETADSQPVGSELPERPASPVAEGVTLDLRAPRTRVLDASTSAAPTRRVIPAPTQTAGEPAHSGDTPSVVAPVESEPAESDPRSPATENSIKERVPEVSASSPIDLPAGEDSSRSADVTQRPASDHRPRLGDPEPPHRANRRSDTTAPRTDRLPLSLRDARGTPVELVDEPVRHPTPPGVRPTEFRARPAVTHVSRESGQVATSRDVRQQLQEASEPSRVRLTPASEVEAKSNPEGETKSAPAIQRIPTLAQSLGEVEQDIERRLAPHEVEPVHQPDFKDSESLDTSRVSKPTFADIRQRPEERPPVKSAEFTANTLIVADSATREPTTLAAGAATVPVTREPTAPPAREPTTLLAGSARHLEAVGVAVRNPANFVTHADVAHSDEAPGYRGRLTAKSGSRESSLSTPDRESVELTKKALPAQVNPVEVKRPSSRALTTQPVPNLEATTHPSRIPIAEPATYPPNPAASPVSIPDRVPSLASKHTATATQVTSAEFTRQTVSAEASHPAPDRPEASLIAHSSDAPAEDAVTPVRAKSPEPRSMPSRSRSAELSSNTPSVQRGPVEVEPQPTAGETGQPTPRISAPPSSAQPSKVRAEDRSTFNPPRISADHRLVVEQPPMSDDSTSKATPGVSMSRPRPEHPAPNQPETTPTAQRSEAQAPNAVAAVIGRDPPESVFNRFFNFIERENGSEFSRTPQPEHQIAQPVSVRLAHRESPSTPVASTHFDEGSVESANDMTPRSHPQAESAVIGPEPTAEAPIVRNVPVHAMRDTRVENRASQPTLTNNVEGAIDGLPTAEVTLQDEAAAIALDRRRDDRQPSRRQHSPRSNPFPAASPAGPTDQVAPHDFARHIRGTDRPSDDRPDARDAGFASTPARTAEAMNSSTPSTTTQPSAFAPAAGTHASVLNTTATTAPSVQAQISAGIVSWAMLSPRPKETELRMRLNPAELGALRVQVVQRDGGLSVTMIAADESARQAIESQLDQLRQSLSDAGLELSNCNVSCDDRRSGGEQDRPASVPATRSENTGRAESTGAKVGAPRASVLTDDRVDVLA